MQSTAFYILLLSSVVITSAGTALGQTAQMRADREIYAGLPFEVTITTEGFDGDAPPEIKGFEVKGAKVTLLGVSPQVFQSMVQDAQGRVTRERRVSYVFRYRVDAPKAGSYTIPTVEVVQGSRKASARGGAFTARDIGASPDMRLELSMPERPLWVGETFELGIDWFLRSDPQKPKFFVPLFDQEDLFRVSASVPEKGQRTLEFTISERELELPFQREKTNKSGTEFDRFRFRARITPQKAGTYELPAATVVASLQTGVGRDRFGFRSRRTGLFKATDRSRTLTIKPLPSSGRPAGFTGAVGTGFSIEAQASRTVVQVGDPIELSLKVRGDAHLDALRPPDLAGKHALPSDSFEVIDVPATGEPTDDGKARLFRVTVRLKTTDVREIPSLPFSYFNPATGKYETSRSRPIALSVAGSSVVGAGQVVSGAKVAKDASATASGPGADANLSLSKAGDTSRTTWTVKGITPLLAVLYILPLVILFGRTWQLRTRQKRGKASQSKRARKAVEKAVASARTTPAREAVAPLVAALRELAKETGHSARVSVIEEIETQGYAPQAATDPLPASLLEKTLSQATEWDKARKSAGPGSAAAAVLLALMVVPSTARSNAGADPQEEARSLYNQALGTKDRDQRASGFAKAADFFAKAIDDNADKPELLTDWGNAALGARDFGTAALAYRRALVLDRKLERARKNLSWLRSRAPDDMPQAQDGGAVDSLFFWHRGTSRAGKHLVAALGFAAFILLLVPWSPGRRRGLRKLSILPLLLCLAMWASLLFERTVTHDVVVVGDAAVLRIADSPGAGAARPAPLPPGTEGVVRDRRQGWLRIAVGGGFEGWLPESAVAFVIPR